jgi:hypothetical protein
MHLFPRQSTRRALLLAATSLSLACGGAEEGLDDTAVVTLPGRALSTTDLRDILLLAPTIPGEDAAYGAVSIWTDLALVTQASASGELPGDDAAMAAIIRPVMMEGTIQRYGASRAGSVSPTPSQVDSVVRGTNVRVFRSYAIRPVDPVDSARVIAEGRRLQNLKQQAIAEGSPAAAMRRLGTASSDIEVGDAQATSRSELPEQLANTIWRLYDNELSDPIIGNGGVQIFERIPNAAAREAVIAWLTPVVQRRADAAYIDSIMASRQLTVTDGGAARLRAAGMEPGTFGSEDPLVTWSGGDLSPAEARSWMAMMPAPERARLRLASDTSLGRMLDLMGRREILFELAVGAGVDTNAVRDELVPVFREQLDALVGDARSAGDPTKWFLDILEGRRQFRPLPGALPMLLRDRAQMSVDTDALAAAMREAARTWQARGAPQMP